MDEEKQSTEVGNKPNSESTVADLINITIKTVDSQNFQFQVENNVSNNKIFKLGLNFIYKFYYIT